MRLRRKTLLALLALTCSACVYQAWELRTIQEQDDRLYRTELREIVTEFSHSNDNDEDCEMVDYGKVLPCSFGGSYQFSEPIQRGVKVLSGAGGLGSVWAWWPRLVLGHWRLPHIERGRNSHAVKEKK